MRIIAEVGSTHGGRLELCKRAVDICVELKVDAVKFQLFPNKAPFVGSGNVWLPPDIFLETVEYAHEQNMQCSASVFDEDSFEFLLSTSPDFIKFAYSKKDRLDWIKDTLSNGYEAIVSCDVMTEASLPKHANLKKLLCIPQYPVYFQVAFDALFPRFDGFSDHTLGFEQSLLAMDAGAKILEKHIKLSANDSSCPDSHFSLSPAELATMVAHIRRKEMK